MIKTIFVKVVAILAIFFAIELESAGLERMVTWVVVSYVGFHVLAHTVLTVNTCWSDSSSSDRSEVYPITGDIIISQTIHRYIIIIIVIIIIAGNPDSLFLKDKRGGSFRKFCFGLYFIVTWSIVSLVLIMIWLSPVTLFSGAHHAHDHSEHSQDDIDEQYLY